MRSSISRRSFFCLTLLLLLLMVEGIVFFARMPDARAAPLSDAGIELEMKHRMLGHMRVLAGEMGGRVDTSHYSFVLPYPGTNVILVNDQARRYTTFSLAEWKKKFGFYLKESHGRVKHREDEFTDYSKWKRVGTAKIAGLKATQYSRFRTNNRPAPRDKLYTEDVWFTKGFKIRPTLLDTLRRSISYDFEDSMGMPLRVRETREWAGKARRKVDVTFDTIAFREKTVKKDDFNVPKSYARVQDEMAVLMDDTDDNLLSPPFGAISRGSGGLPAKR
ncbi:MAG TPA: hypothetical protein V6D17_16260 [Candidatus Obscuribacterales bacterium]